MLTQLLKPNWIDGLLMVYIHVDSERIWSKNTENDRSPIANKENAAIADNNMMIS